MYIYIYITYVVCHIGYKKNSKKVLSFQPLPIPKVDSIHSRTATTPIGRCSFNPLNPQVFVTPFLPNTILWFQWFGKNMGAKSTIKIPMFCVSNAATSPKPFVGSVRPWSWHGRHGTVSQGFMQPDLIHSFNCHFRDLNPQNSKVNGGVNSWFKSQQEIHASANIHGCHIANIEAWTLKAFPI